MYRCERCGLPANNDAIVTPLGELMDPACHAFEVAEAWRNVENALALLRNLGVAVNVVPPAGLKSVEVRCG